MSDARVVYSSHLYWPKPRCSSQGSELGGRKNITQQISWRKHLHTVLNDTIDQIATPNPIWHRGQNRIQSTKPKQRNRIYRLRHSVPVISFPETWRVKALFKLRYIKYAVLKKMALRKQTFCFSAKYSTLLASIFGGLPWKACDMSLRDAQTIHVSNMWARNSVILLVLEPKIVRT